MTTNSKERRAVKRGGESFCNDDPLKLQELSYFEGNDLEELSLDTITFGVTPSPQNSEAVSPSKTKVSLRHVQKTKFFLSSTPLQNLKLMKSFSHSLPKIPSLSDTKKPKKQFRPKTDPFIAYYADLSSQVVALGMPKKRLTSTQV